jgi:hypothetical protein
VEWERQNERKRRVVLGSLIISYHSYTLRVMVGSEVDRSRNKEILQGTITHSKTLGQ